MNDHAATTIKYFNITNLPSLRIDWWALLSTSAHRRVVFEPCTTEIETPPSDSALLQAAIDADEHKWDELFATPESEAFLALFVQEMEAAEEKGVVEPLDFSRL